MINILFHPLRNLRMREKLILISTISSAIALLLAGFIFYTQDSTRIMDDILRETRMLAKMISSRSTAALIYQDADLALENLDSLKFQPAIITACIYTKKGALFAAYDASESQSTHCLLQPVKEGFQWLEENQKLREEVGVQEGLVLSQSIFLNGKNIGTINIFTDLRDVKANNRQTFIIVGGALFLSTVVAMLLSVALQRIISKPLKTLTSVVADISNTKDYSVRVKKHSNDELGVLVDQFNQMLDTIEEQNRYLLESFELRERIISESPIGIAIFDNSGQCIAANEAITNNMGTKNKQILNQSYHHIESWKKSGLYDMAVDAVTQRKKNHQEIELAGNFGKRLSLDCQMVPFTADDKLNLLVMTTDISERKQAEAELDFRHEMSRAMTKTLSIYITNSGQMAQVFGQLLDELLGLTGSAFGFVGELLYRENGAPYLKARAITDISWSDETSLFYRENAPKGLEFDNLNNLFGWTIKNNEPLITNNPDSYERSSGRPEGHPPLNAFAGIPLRQQDEIIGMVGIANRADGYNSKFIEKLEPFFQTCATVLIACRTAMELEKHREHLEELVEARTIELRKTHEKLIRKEHLATLGQLTATVSHEIRNPLGVISTSMYTVRKRIGDSDPRLIEATARIDRNISRCNHIIDEMLDYARVQDLEREPTAIDTWLNAVLNEMAVPEGLIINREFHLPGQMVSLDPRRFRQVVVNVYDNACQAMCGDGTVKQSSIDKKLTVSTRADGKRVEIVFSDTGPGIPEDVLANIFEPLFSTKSFGVGLGMSIVKQIIEQHGGEVEIDTEPGHGTRLVLWLPIYEISTSYSYSDK